MAFSLCAEGAFGSAHMKYRPYEIPSIWNTVHMKKTSWKMKIKTT